MPIAIGVDIGGSHISSAAVNMNTLEIISGTYNNGAVDSKASKEEIFEHWAHVINKTLEKVKNEEILGIGMAMPGPFEYKKGIALFEENDKYEALYEVSVGEEFPGYLLIKNMKMRFLNDASSFGLGGYLSSKLKDAKKIIAVTLGTGFGASFLKNRVPVINGNDVPEGGCLWDKEFKESFADDYFSTRWFLQKHLELTGSNGIKGVKDIVEEDNGSTKEIFEEFAKNLSEFMLPYLEKFDADLLVLGGNITKAHSLFLPKLKQYWEQNNCNVATAIIENTEEASIIGSSYLFNELFWKSAKKELPTR